MNTQQYIGMKLYGYCDGRFGSDWEPKTIEAAGRDWRFYV